MKTLIAVTIDAPSHNDIEEAKRNIVKACVIVKDRTNNGSEIKISACDAENFSQMTSLFGKLKWWSLGHSSQKQITKKPREKTMMEELSELI